MDRKRTYLCKTIQQQLIQTVIIIMGNKETSIMAKTCSWIRQREHIITFSTGFNVCTELEPNIGGSGTPFKHHLKAI